MKGPNNIRREEFKEFLKEEAGENYDRLLDILDFGLYTFLNQEGELQDSQNIYDVTDIDTIEAWYERIYSEPSWRAFDEEQNGLVSRALLEYLLFNKNISEHLLPGIEISKGRQTISIDSDDNPDVAEGSVSDVLVTRYERSRLARKLCIEAYGNTYRCEVCGFRMADRYGHREGRPDYIEVHHIIGHAERSKLQGSHEVNYRDELIPLCPNCHRMIHHLKAQTIHPDELRKIIKENES